MSPRRPKGCQKVQMDPEFRLPRTPAMLESGSPSQPQRKCVSAFAGTIHAIAVHNMACKPYALKVMVWTVLFHPDFEPEFELLPEGVQDKLLARIAVLEQFGSSLGRPIVDTLTASS